MGLVNHVMPTYDLAMEKAIGLATQIGKQGPIAIRAAKQAVNHGVNMDLNSALKYEEECQHELMASEDRREGLQAFAEKRKPKYYGK